MSEKGKESKHVIREKAVEGAELGSVPGLPLCKLLCCQFLFLRLSN